MPSEDKPMPKAARDLWSAIIVLLSTTAEKAHEGAANNGASPSPYSAHVGGPSESVEFDDEICVISSFLAEAVV